MFRPASQTIAVADVTNDNQFQLHAISFEVRDDANGVFHARVKAPVSAAAWVRCWVSNAVEGSLAEADTRSTDGELVELAIQLDTPSVPELASIRIESAPLQTENVYSVRLCHGETYLLDQVRLELNDAQATLEMVASLSPEMRAEVSPDWLRMVESATESIGWIHGFSVFDQTTNQRVGQGGFKGLPKDGQVEIAYGVEEQFQRQGYGSNIGIALTKYGFGQSNEVATIVAHTMPGHEASARILQKAGYARVGEVEDPEDGTVIRWEIQRPNC